MEKAIKRDKIRLMEEIEKLRRNEAEVEKQKSRVVDLRNQIKVAEGVFFSFFLSFSSQLGSLSREKEREDLEHTTNELLYRVEKMKDPLIIEKLVNGEFAEKNDSGSKVRSKISSVFREEIQKIFEGVDNKIEIMVQFQKKNLPRFIEIDKTFGEIKPEITKLFSLDADKVFFRIPKSGIVLETMKVREILLPLGNLKIKEELPRLEMVLMYDMTFNQIIMKKVENIKNENSDSDDMKERNDRIGKLIETKNQIEINRNLKKKKSKEKWVDELIYIFLNFFYFFNIFSFCLIQVYSSDIFEMNL